MKVTAIIVTYNRLPLLKECIEAVQHQTRKPDQVIVINNSSTDGTEEWLSAHSIEFITQPNRGGAWGYYTGIKTAYEDEADWIWVMDDDTIPRPDALEHLLHAGNNIPGTGCLCSKVIWTDGTPHKMNLPEIWPHILGYPFNQFDEFGAQLIKSASFVSLLISRAAVKKAGLPLKEFFIWTDDHEYTDRIQRSGLLPFYVGKSVVLHKTPTNHGSNIYTDEAKDIWKYRYGIRNELYFIRSRKGDLKFWRLVFKRFVAFPFRIYKKRKTDRWRMIKTVWGATADAIGFHPKVDHVD